MPNLTLISAACRPCGAKNPKIGPWVKTIPAELPAADPAGNNNNNNNNNNYYYYYIHFHQVLGVWCEYHCEHEFVGGSEWIADIQLTGIFSGLRIFGVGSLRTRSILNIDWQIVTCCYWLPCNHLPRNRRKLRKMLQLVFLILVGLCSTHARKRSYEVPGIRHCIDNSSLSRVQRVIVYRKSHAFGNIGPKLKPGFHYPSWLVVHQHGPSTRLVETRPRQHGPCWRVMETGHPSIRAVNSDRQLG